MKLRSSPEAFTLIELLLVMVLISILLSVSFESFSSMRQNMVFRDSTQKFMDMIQGTRSRALSNLELDTGETADAFYLMIDTTTKTITMYADIPGTGDDKVLAEEVLDPTVTITLNPGDLKQIKYVPPKGELELIFTSEASTGTNLTDLIILLDNGTSQERITLNEISGVPE